MRELGAKRHQVAALQESRAQGAMHLNRAANDAIGDEMVVIHAVQ